MKKTGNNTERGIKEKKKGQEITKITLKRSQWESELSLNC